jgi:hypothetical protein
MPYQREVKQYHTYTIHAAAGLTQAKQLMHCYHLPGVLNRRTVHVVLMTQCIASPAFGPSKPTAMRTSCTCRSQRVLAGTGRDVPAGGLRLCNAAFNDEVRVQDILHCSSLSKTAAGVWKLCTTLGALWQQRVPSEHALPLEALPHAKAALKMLYALQCCSLTCIVVLIQDVHVGKSLSSAK